MEAKALNRTEETLQTVLTLLDPQTREHVLAEMKDFAESDPANCKEQYEIATRIAESDHTQESW